MTDRPTEKDMAKTSGHADEALDADYGSVHELKTIHVDGIDPVFEAQATLINHAIQTIGMGKYQWALFVLCGYGWLCDQLWQTTVSDALALVGVEFNVEHPAFLSLALIAGLVVGATFWGLGADLIGRRLAFNLTLFIGGVFGLCAGAATSFIGCAVLVAFCGFGIGGNLVVDSAVGGRPEVIIQSAANLALTGLPRILAWLSSIPIGDTGSLVVVRPSYTCRCRMGFPSKLLVRCGHSTRGVQASRQHGLEVPDVHDGCCDPRSLRFALLHLPLARITKVFMWPRAI